MKTNNFRGDLTNVSATKEALNCSTKKELVINFCNGDWTQKKNVLCLCRDVLRFSAMVGSPKKADISNSDTNSDTSDDLIQTVEH